ncbi:MAG: hypothetical protein DRR06_16480 [Gammaproteobacteria bacterium]|nr:MAG: hypothetical protein DRR06_16480 [Gammaproteobacteria bacterium]
MQSINLKQIGIVVAVICGTAFMPGLVAGANPPQMFIDLPAGINTPDGAALAPDGSIILSIPNFNNGALLEQKVIDKPAPEKMVIIDNNNNLETWYVFSDADKHRETGKIGPMDAAFGPDGNLYVADMQIFWGGDHKSRLLRINVVNGKAISMDVVVEGFIVANGMAWKGDTLFVSETILAHTPKLEDGMEKPSLLSGVYAFTLAELTAGPVQLIPYNEFHSDPHLVLRLHSSNRVGFGADGVTVDASGNLYTSVIEDGVIYKTTFDTSGKPVETRLFAKSELMRSADGIIWRQADEKIYVADMLLNAVHAVDNNGNVETLHKNGDTNGQNGLLDQPAEVIIRGNELIIVNMDMPWNDPQGLLVNTTIDEPFTLSVIHLD